MAGSADIRLRQIPKDMLAEFWPVILKHVETGCAYSGGRFTPDAILAAGTTGEMQVFLAVRGDTEIVGVGVTCLSHYPTGLKVCDVLIVGGATAGLWADMQHPLTRWAKGEGCERIQMVGRKGWGKALPDWKVVATMYEREIA